MELQELLVALRARLDEYDEDPRSALMRELERYIGMERIDGSPDIRLVARIAQGGAYSVTDQDGRPVVGVRSVAAFKDQDGTDVLQINL